MTQNSCFFALSEYLESTQLMHWFSYESARGPCYSHRIIEVSDHPGTLARGRITKARVVGVTDDALHPGQGPRWGHGLVWEMAWKGKGQHTFFIISFKFGISSQFTYIIQPHTRTLLTNIVILANQVNSSVLTLRSRQPVTCVFTTFYPWKCPGTAVKPVTYYPWTRTRLLYSQLQFWCHTHINNNVNPCRCWTTVKNRHK